VRLKGATCKNFKSMYVCQIKEIITHNLHCFESSLDQVKVKIDDMHPCQIKASLIPQH
jgi:hypothetical protein